MKKSLMLVAMLAVSCGGETPLVDVFEPEAPVEAPADPLPPVIEVDAGTVAPETPDAGVDAGTDAGGDGDVDAGKPGNGPKCSKMPAQSKTKHCR